MTATAKGKTKKKKSGAEALKRSKIKVRIIGEEFDFQDQEPETVEVPANEPAEAAEEPVKAKEAKKKEADNKNASEKKSPAVPKKKFSIKFPFAKKSEKSADIEKKREPEAAPIITKDKPSAREELIKKTEEAFTQEPDKKPSQLVLPKKISKKAPEEYLEEKKRIKEIKEEIRSANLGLEPQEGEEVKIEDDGQGGVIVSPKGSKEGRKFFSFFMGKKREKTRGEIIEGHNKKRFLRKIGADPNDLEAEKEAPKEKEDEKPVADSDEIADFGTEEKKEIKFRKVKAVPEGKTPKNKILKLKKAVSEEIAKEPEAGAEAEKDLMEEVPRPRSIKLYRKISFFFIFLTLILITAVFLLAFVSMTITVVPKSETINEKIIVNVFDEEKNQKSNFSREAIVGEVIQVEVLKDNKYETTGAEIISRDIRGKVRIINEYGYSQPLVAKTRLLTPDDKLFRIIETINIPAGGEVEVEITADDPSEEMAVAPTRFSIPGLPAFKQDKVYAENDEKFIYETQIKKYVQQIDIDKGVSDLKEILRGEVEAQYGSQYKGNDSVIYEIDKNSIEIELGAGVNEEADEFEIKIKAIVNLVAFKTAEIKKLSEDKLASIIPSNKKLLSVSDEDMEYSLSNYSFKQGVATVEANFSALVALDEAKGLLDKSKLVGLNEDQIIKFLESEGKFDSFQIEFSPSFIKKAPQLTDRIKIQISK